MAYEHFLFKTNAKKFQKQKKSEGFKTKLFDNGQFEVLVVYSKKQSTLNNQIDLLKRENRIPQNS